MFWAAGAFADCALTVELASAEGPRAVVGGAGGLVVQATAALDADGADWIVVPGAEGPLTGRDDPEAVTIPVLLARTIDADLPRLVAEALGREDRSVATVCGSLALTMAGFWRGVTSGLHLALYLVGRELGPRIAHAVELFEYERRGSVWRANGIVPLAL